ncbi:thyrotroph embryonic factor-like [Physella acuta]|uniref:thyrotroph embryonic factor-like n=1 Tax=Physella acuta TaxID=109671 RepID=UPI0027DE7807|nr:thyrotroph embryonic factor-like [Physella acuta]
MTLQPNFLGSITLKALLEDPALKNPAVIDYSSEQLKVKKEKDGADIPQFNYGSAFLGPNLWDRSITQSDFNLEYMDLDEFLSENGIPVASDETVEIEKEKLKDSIMPSATLDPSSSANYLKSPPGSPLQYIKNTPSCSSQITLQTVINKSPTPPSSPFNVEFQVSDQDLALTSIPDYGEDSSCAIPRWQAQPEDKKGKNGQEDFDPRNRNFTDEELKPQPIIKKSKKVFVPDDLKDEKYWARRHKNNYAAKRSRDARRVKENQIALRAAFLEKENMCLRDEMNKLRKENAKLKAKITKYEDTTVAETSVSK